MAERTYQVLFQPSALKGLRKLSSNLQDRIIAATTRLEEEPRPLGCKKLTNGSYRIRVGDYRVVYDIFDDRILVLVLSVKHRREVYREI